MREMIISILNLFENFISISALEREITAHKNVQENSDRPIITLRVIISTLDFRSHVIRSTGYSLQLLSSSLPFRESKINEFQFTSITYHNIFWLDISMYDTLSMHVVKGTKKLANVLKGCIFIKNLILLLGNFFKQLTATNILHDKVNVFFIFISFIVLDNIWMV